MIIADIFSGLPELGPYSSGRNTHDDGLDNTDFIVGQAGFLGDAKEIFHSRVATDGEGRGQLDHHRCLIVERFVFNRGLEKRLIGLPLLFGQHGFPFMCGYRWSEPNIRMMTGCR